MKTTEELNALKEELTETNALSEDIFEQASGGRDIPVFEPPTTFEVSCSIRNSGPAISCQLHTKGTLIQCEDCYRNC